jgi:hypothetical protein
VGTGREEAHSFAEAVRDLPRAAWQQIKRRFHDGHRERWWVAELAFLHFGPRKAVRALCVTTDRRRLPSQTTWYLSSNLKGSPLEEIIQLYAWRNWTEQGYKYVKGELGWADFQVRGDTAIRRHWALVCAAFSFCWWQAAREGRLAGPHPVRPGLKPAPAGRAGAGKKYPPEAPPLLAEGAASGASLAGTFPLAHALLEGLGAGPATAGARNAA